MNVGTDHDTAAFAVESIRRWWQRPRPATDYPAARRLLITADAGGSNGYRTRAWKTELAALAAETGLEITVCHFPPGTSKWNKIEHRLFSHITMNWRGRPLTSHEVIVSTIAATTTRTGLTVHAELDTGSYPTGVKISDAQLAALPLTRHDWHGDWNYTLRPAPPPRRPAPARAARPGPAGPGLARPPRHHRPDRPRPGRPHRRPDRPSRRQLREAALNRRRGHRPRQQPPAPAAAPGSPSPTSSLAAILHDRHGLPQQAIAALYSASATKPSAATSATSAAPAPDRATPSSPPRTSSPPSTTSTATPPQQASPIQQRSRPAC